MAGEGGEGAPLKRPWLWPFPKALTSLSLKKPLSLLLPVSPFFSLLLLHLNFYLFPQGEDGFPGFKGDGGPKGDRVRPAPS